MDLLPDASQTPRRVRHPLHGAGVVRALRRGGRVAVVAFDGQPLPLEVAARELTPLDGAPLGRPTPSSPLDLTDAPALEGSVEEALAALTLEAMRLGVVPSAELGAYTVGRDAELAVVEADLDRAAAAGAARAFLGDYGAGKTHMLELLQQVALRRNFLTARVVLDPQETSPAHPRRVHRALMRGLRYPDRPFEEGAGLRPLLERARARPEALAAVCAPPTHARASTRDRLSAGAHLYLSAALAYWRSLHADDAAARLRGVASDAADAHLERARDLLLDWLEGHPTISNQVIDAALSRLPGHHPKVYSLLDHRPWARIYGYLLSGLASLAQACDYSGLVVLLDEAEFYALLSNENRAFAQTLFQALTAAALGPDAEDPPLPFDPTTLRLCGHGVQRTLTPWYPGGRGLMVAFAMTPSVEGLDALREAVPDPLITELSPLSTDDHLTLASRVCDFYASAYPDWSLPRPLVEPLARVMQGLISAGYIDSPRHAMKFIIDFLDVVRHTPDRVGRLVRGLQGLSF